MQTHNNAKEFSYNLTISSLITGLEKKSGIFSLITGLNATDNIKLNYSKLKLNLLQVQITEALNPC